MFDYNQKVVPIGKSVCGTLKDSVVWKKAQKRCQNFLYFVGTDELSNFGEYICSYDPDTKDGDFFLLQDLIPYVEDNVITSIREDAVEITLKSLIMLKNAGLINEDDLLLVCKA